MKMKHMSICLALTLVSLTAPAQMNMSLVDPVTEVTLATSEAVAMFKAEFEAEEGKALTDEVLGFEWKRDQDESIVRIFEVKADNELGAEDYRCHFDGPEEAHCDYEASQNRQTYTAPKRVYSKEELQIGLAEAVRLISSVVDPVAEMSSVKVWQDGKLIQVLITSKSAVSALNCHMHGSAIDCHRQRRPGAGEPQF